MPTTFDPIMILIFLRYAFSHEQNDCDLIVIFVCSSMALHIVLQRANCPKLCQVGSNSTTYTCDTSFFYSNRFCERMFYWEFLPRIFKAISRSRNKKKCSFFPLPHFTIVTKLFMNKPFKITSDIFETEIQTTFLFRSYLGDEIISAHYFQVKTVST